MIGAGNFAKMTMGPALANTGARLKYVAARTSGAAATDIAKKYGFENATTDLALIWDDPEVNAVFIATGHDSHAELVKRSLASNKHTFVEKPLCLNRDQLDEIAKAYFGLQSSTSKHCHLMVGFNRRFSPHLVKIKELLKGRGEPLAMNLTVNAGILPKDVWVHDPELGGGRIIGEACHHIDLLSHICGRGIVSVVAAQMGKKVAVTEDKMAIILSLRGWLHRNRELLREWVKGVSQGGAGDFFGRAGFTVG